MKKHWILALMIGALVASAGCNDSNMTTHFLTAPDSDVNLRLGMTVGAEKNAEIALEVGYDSSQMNNDGTPDRVGGVFIYHLTQELQLEDTPGYSPFKDALEFLNARPYIGLGCMIERGTSELEAKWVVGTTFADNPDRPWAFVVEYQDSDGMVTARDDSAVFFGARLEF